MNTGHGTSSRAQRQSLAARLTLASVRASMLVVIALVPWLYSLGNELFLTRLHGHEGGDLAVLELGIFDAWDGKRLVGPYSRFGWNHPGPLYFYLLLPIYALSSASSAALFITSSLIGCCALGCLSWVGWRAFRDVRRSWLLLVPITLLALTPVLFGVALRPWNPVVIVLPFGLLLLLAAHLAAGRISVLPWVIALHAFVTQTHVGAALSASLIVVVACGRLALDRQGLRWQTVRIPLGIAVAVASVVWLPVLVDQVAGERNLDALVQFARRSRATLGPARGLRFAARQLAGFVTEPLGLRGAGWSKTFELSSGIVLCVLLPFSARRARALGEPVIERLIVLTGVGLIAASVSATRIVGEAHDYLAYFMFALGALGWGAALAVWAPARAPRGAATLLIGAALAVPLTRTLPHARTSPSAQRPAADAHAALMQGMLDDVETVRSWKCSPVLTTGWYAGDDDWGLLAKLLVELTRRNESATLQTRHRFMFGDRFSYRRSGDCELAFSRVRDRSLPILSRHGEVFTHVSPPDSASRVVPNARSVAVGAAQGVTGNPARILQAAEPNAAKASVRFAGPEAAIELELPGAPLRSAWLDAASPSDYLLEGAIERGVWEPLGQFSAAGDLLREPGAPDRTYTWGRLRKTRGPAGELSRLSFEFDAFRFVLKSASGCERIERIVDGSIPPFDALPQQEQIAVLARDARIRLRAPAGGLLRGLSVVADLRGAYRLSGSSDERTFHELGEIAAGPMPGLGRHNFFLEETLAVLEIAAIGEAGPHALAEVTPMVWDGVDFAVGTPRGRRYLLEGWSEDAADRHSAYVWLLDRAGLGFPERPRIDHTLTFWLAVHDEPDQKPVLTVTAAGSRLAARPLIVGEQTVRVTIPAKLMDPSLRVEVALEYSPREIAGGTDGEREPSVAVRRIVLSKAEPYVRSASAATVF